MTNPKTRIFFLVFILTLMAGIVFRLRNFGMPPIDAHAMRQTDTECVAHFLAKDGQWFYPKSCLLRPASNTDGYFFLEFPAYQALIAAGYRLLGESVIVVRVVNLGLYILMMVYMWRLVVGLTDKKTGLAAVFVFSFMPGAIFFAGHAIHPDVFALTTMVVGLMMYLSYKEKGRVWRLGAAGLLLGLSGATRPFGLMVLPTLAVIMRQKKAKWPEYVWLGLTAVGIYGLWRLWADTAGADVTWENWVMEGREKMFDFGIVKNLIWKNVAGETIGKVVSLLAAAGMLIGLLKKEVKLLPWAVWMVMVPVYWLIAPNGNLVHQYYANVYLIPVAVLAGYGLMRISEMNKYLAVIAVALVMVNGWRTSGYFFDNYDLENVRLAEEIDQFVPEGKKILYLYRANSVPISLAHRQGWMVGEWPTDVGSHAWSVVEMRHKADYVVLPKRGYPGVEGEDLRVVLQNLEIENEGEWVKVYRWK